MTGSTYFDLHGLTLGVFADEPVVVEAIRRRLAPLATDAHAAPDLRFELVEGRLGSPPGVGRPIYDAPAGSVLYFEEADALYLDHGQRLQWRCDPASGVTRISVPARDAEDVWLAAHPLLTLALMEALKRRGRYSLHAACVSRAGRGIVIAGPSGAGKSTTAVALARAGMHLLSDDMVFVAPGATGLEVIAFPDEVDFTDHTAALFPELVGPSTTASTPWRPKLSVRPEAAHLVLAPRCQPAALVLVEVGDGERSTLAEVDPAEALMAVLPDILLTEASSTQSHLDVLGELVKSLPCFRLVAGRDVEQLAQLLWVLVA